MQILRKSILLCSISLILLSCGQNGDITPLTGGTDENFFGSSSLIGSWRNYNSDAGEYFYWIFESNNKFMYGSFDESLSAVNVYSCLDFITSDSELIFIYEGGGQEIYKIILSGNSLEVRNISSSSTVTFVKANKPNLIGNVCETF